MLPVEDQHVNIVGSPAAVKVIVTLTSLSYKKQMRINDLVILSLYRCIQTHVNMCKFARVPAIVRFQLR